MKPHPFGTKRERMGHPPIRDVARSPPFCNEREERVRRRLWLWPPFSFFGYSYDR